MNPRRLIFALGVLGWSIFAQPISFAQLEALHDRIVITQLSVRESKEKQLKDLQIEYESLLAQKSAITIRVRIGHAGPLTGGIAHLGKDNENGVRLALDEANAKDIKIAGKFVRFELKSEDDQADPKLGPTIAQKMADANVVGVVGHLSSGVTIPASTVYHQYGIPVITGSATNPRLTEQGFKNVFRVTGKDNHQGSAVAQYLSSINVQRVAIADDATGYGERLADDVEKMLKLAGVQVVAREKSDSRASDFKAILTKMKAKLPDAVFYGGMDTTGGLMLRQARELGLKSLFAFGDIACTAEMANIAGDAAEGLICSQVGLPPSAAKPDFVKAFNAKYGEVIMYAPFTYDAANLLIAAMQGADSVDPRKYLPELQKIKWMGATGQIQFDENGDRRDAAITIFTLRKAGMVPIAVVTGNDKPVSLDEYAAKRRNAERTYLLPAPLPSGAANTTVAEQGSASSTKLFRDSTSPDSAKVPQEQVGQGPAAITAPPTRIPPATISDADREALRKDVIGKLSRISKLELVLVTGHAMGTSPQETQRRSEKYADAVRNFLVAGGVPKDKIETLGMGMTQPIPGATRFDPAQNRTEVEVKGIAADGSIVTLASKVTFR